MLKRLCRENIGDRHFTGAERTYTPGAVVQVELRDSEAIHILKGSGAFRAWPKNVPADFPVQAPLQPGMEIVVDQFVRHEIRSLFQSAPGAITGCKHTHPAFDRPFDVVSVRARRHGQVQARSSTTSPPTSSAGSPLRRAN